MGCLCLSVIQWVSALCLARFSLGGTDSIHSPDNRPTIRSRGLKKHSSEQGRAPTPNPVPCPHKKVIVVVLPRLNKLQPKFQQRVGCCETKHNKGTCQSHISVSWNILAHFEIDGSNTSKKKYRWALLCSIPSSWKTSLQISGNRGEQLPEFWERNAVRSLYDVGF